MWDLTIEELAVLGVLVVEAGARVPRLRSLPPAGKPPASLSSFARCMRFHVMNVVLRCVNCSPPAAARVEVGRAGPCLADPAAVGLRRDGVADVLEAVEDVARAVLDAVLVARDDRLATRP